MKITVDISQMAYKGTGVARYTTGLVKGLRSATTNHQFEFVAFTKGQQDFFRSLDFPVKVWPIPASLSSYILSNSPLKLDYLFGKPDILHCSDWTEPNTTAVKVTTVHDLVFHLYKDTVHPTIIKAQKLRLKKIISNKTHIIVDSLSTKNDLIKYYSINSSLIDVVYPGIESSYKPFSSKEIEQVKLKYKISGKYLLSVGTQEPRKNLSRTIEAFNKLKNMGHLKDYSLILVGKYGWGEKLILPPDVVSIGYVQENDLPPLYSGADVFVYPSLYEGFGFPVLEAMACGTPVVTSNTSSLKEIAGDSAILVDPQSIDSIASGIVTALQDGIKLRASGIAQASKYTWKNAIDQIISIYEKIGFQQ